LLELYWPPIIERLIELGGHGSRTEVIERVGKKLEPILTQAARGVMPSGAAVRWKNRVTLQRLNMVERGLLRNDSRRGTWEVTAEGRKWLTDTLTNNS
jgi:restriction endonuclease Mrr